MSLVFIALGSNIGDGRQYLEKAWKLLGNVKGITPLTLSAPYMSKPVRKTDLHVECQDFSEQWFTNAVGAIETNLDPQTLLEATMGIENTLGRNRELTVDRTIDLDLLYYDDLVIAEERLILPHPEMHKRHFVLAPLADIAPDHRHPALHLSSSAMLRALPFAGRDVIYRTAWEKEVTPK
ncbi:MAG: 2-amino-4-hydroxy-6-hydroxymethyldihydropteridine diphosphokinase [Proteobacteria bacterium]|nr:2-amino-4-hydroxy-6-hydroxymethyldihydropteridine diphosphokinase [Pseudomonadota bacterium]MBU1737506.1 2-amino-4-hydroxy-6-hydroxymethyldihydropteridine diphosphokinase [Pseudomonadota bacterium]